MVFPEDFVVQKLATQSDGIDRYKIENAIDFGVFFWGTKFCNILKLSALWGLIVFVVCGIIHNETLLLVGCGMCGGSVLFH